MSLIAQIRILAFVVAAEGTAPERKEFKPGEEVTGLSAHDETELLKSNALRDSEDDADEAMLEQRQKRRAMTSFHAERERIQAAAESIKPPESSSNAANAGGGGGGGEHAVLNPAPIPPAAPPAAEALAPETATDKAAEAPATTAAPATSEEPQSNAAGKKTNGRNKGD